MLWLLYICFQAQHRVNRICKGELQDYTIVYHATAPYTPLELV